MTLFDAASSARMSVGDQTWLGIERASWIAAVVGLLAVIAALIQIRQLIRRPALKVGLPHDPGGTDRRLLQVSDRVELPVLWADGNALSDPIELSVVAMNDYGATATAWDINFEVRYPPWLRPIREDELKQPPQLNVWSIAKEGLVLNPGGAFWIRTRFRVPLGRERIRMHAIVSLRDVRPIDRLLIVSIKPAQKQGTDRSTRRPSTRRGVFHRPGHCGAGRACEPLNESCSVEERLSQTPLRRRVPYTWRRQLRVQCVMRAAPWPKPVGEAEEVHLVDAHPR
jgi:hypothetical protein